MGYAAAIGVMLVVIVLAIGLLQIRILTREATR
jgi:ABC-type sugar transport system permease subunit